LLRCPTTEQQIRLIHKYFKESTTGRNRDTYTTSVGDDKIPEWTTRSIFISLLKINELKLRGISIDQTDGVPAHHCLALDSVDHVIIHRGL